MRLDILLHLLLIGLLVIEAWCFLVGFLMFLVGLAGMAVARRKAARSD